MANVMVENALPVGFVQPNADVLAIVRLFLEKYEVLSDQDKAMYRTIIQAIANPTMIFNGTESGE